MSDPKERASDDIDDFEHLYGADFDVESIDDVEHDAARKVYTQAAWRRLDERMEAKWLREQLSDWDDWDDGLEAH